jgi:hypothetical protein
MINWEACGSKQLWPILRHHSGTCLEDIIKTIKIIQSEQTTPGPKFVPGNFQIWSRSAKKSTAIYGSLSEIFCLFRPVSVQAGDGQNPRPRRLTYQRPKLLLFIINSGTERVRGPNSWQSRIRPNSLLTLAVRVASVHTMFGFPARYVAILVFQLHTVPAEWEQSY